VPTRQGWLALIGAAVSFIVARVFAVRELYVMATGLAIVAIVAIVAVNILKPRVAAERLASAEVLVVGDPARMTVRITPTARWSPALELIEPVGAFNQARLGIGRLDDQSIVAYSVPTDRRGVVQIGPLTAVRRDVLGLAQYRRELAEAVEIAVAPRAIPIEMPSIGRGPLGRHLAIQARRLGVDDFRGLRDYIAGDDIRTIHWKASARGEEFKVKQFEQKGLTRCVVVLDSVGHTDRDRYEAGITAAASVLVSADQAGLNTRFVSGDDIDLRGPQAALHALDYLARVEPVERGRTPLIERDPGDGLGLVVVIAPDRESPAWRALGPLLEPGITVIGVLTGEHMRFRWDVAASDATTFQQAWERLVGRAVSPPTVESPAPVGAMA
jgi:uncharacterized protein (DUF58 family)